MTTIMVSDHDFVSKYMEWNKTCVNEALGSFQSAQCVDEEERLRGGYCKCGYA